MRKILMLLVFICLILSYGKTQDTLTSYFDKDWEVVSKKKDAKHYRMEYFDSEKNLWAVKDYNMSGQIQMSGYYETQKKEVKHGLFIYYTSTGQIETRESFMRGVNHGKYECWYDNGKPYEIIDYRYGKYHGELITYWKNGQQRRKDIFENDILKSGIVWDSLGNEVEYCNFVDMPEFPGGQNELLKFISENIRYPIRASMRRIQGKVFIGFIVDNKGNIRDVSVVKRVHRFLDAEALRVISIMPKWKPGMKEGEPVSVRYQVPINFKLNH
jgi:protein TonB